MNSAVCGKDRMYSRDAGVLAGEILKSGNVVRVGQKADVEDQVAIRRHAIAEAETGDVDHDLGLVALAAEAFLMKSRSSWTVNLEVLMIRSAIARMGASWARSDRMLRRDRSVRCRADAAGGFR